MTQKNRLRISWGLLGVFFKFDSILWPKITKNTLLDFKIQDATVKWFLHGLHPIGISRMYKNAYSDLKWSNEDNEVFSIEQREQYDLVDGGKLYKTYIISLVSLG